MSRLTLGQRTIRPLVLIEIKKDKRNKLKINGFEQSQKKNSTLIWIQTNCFGST